MPGFLFHSQQPKEVQHMSATMTVGQVLKAKGYGFHGIGPDATAYHALELMEEKNVGALLVVEDGALLGVFSERDYARKVILKGRSSKTTTVRDIMSGPPIAVKPDLSLKDCMVLMTRNRVRHLPVTNNDVIMGVISIGDAVNALISEQESTIEELEEYIAGTGYRA
jgi:CBS domain-containing protein